MSTDALSSIWPPLPVSELRRNRAERPVSLSADARARTLIAETLELASVDDFSLKGVLKPEGSGGWRLEAQLEAELAQACVLTLEPAPASLSETVVRVWLPPAELQARLEQLSPDALIDIDPEAEDEEPEALGETIDLGAAALEAVALGLDPYPRAPGAALERSDAAPAGAEPWREERPFEALSALKARLEGGEDA